MRTSSKSRPLTVQQQQNQKDIYELFRQDVILQNKMYPTKPIHASAVNLRSGSSAAQVNWMRLAKSWDSVISSICIVIRF